MGIYSINPDVTNENTMGGDLKELDSLVEAYIYDDLYKLSDTDKQAFIESDEAKSMLEAGVITKKTLVRLSKKDDLSRRATMAAFQLAKENDDPLWDLLVKNRIKERDLIEKIERKYSAKSIKAAKEGQKSYLKNKMPLAFLRPGNIK